MEFGSIDRELHIDASPEIVFEVLSSPEHIKDWWSADTRFDPVEGVTSRLSWVDADSGQEKSTPFTVVEADPPKRFSFRWTYDDQDTGHGNSLLVSFELIPTAHGTNVRFSETGYRERGWEAAVLEAHYRDHSQGWDFYLPRMVTVANRLADAQ